MKRLLTFVLLVVVASGCGRPGEAGAKRSPALAPAPAMAGAQAHRSAASAHLAYAHSLSVDADEQEVPVLFEAAQAACREAVEESCTVLDSRISTGRGASASLKFRAKPNGIGKIIAVLGRQGGIINQSTSAEDLAAPVADVEKKLAMLKDYRSRLEALRTRAGTDVDALIKLNRELAQVQSELEASVGEHARMIQRIETEILGVDISEGERHSFWRPIGKALADFGGNLSEGISIAVTGIAFLVPSIIVLFFLVAGGVKLWRRRKRAGAVA